MRNDLTSGSLFEFWCKVVLYISVSPRPFPFWSDCRGPESLRVAQQKSWHLDEGFYLSMIK